MNGLIGHVIVLMNNTPGKKKAIAWLKFEPALSFVVR
jgi:hypothetical protein